MLSNCCLFRLWSIQILLYFAQRFSAVVPFQKTVESSSDTLPRRNITRSHRLIAESISAGVFMSVIRQVNILPILFLYHVIDTKRIIVGADLPEQEIPINIGQWGIWVSIGLAFLIDTGQRVLTLEKRSSQDSSSWIFRGEREMDDELWPMGKPGCDHAWYDLMYIREIWNEFAEWSKDPMASSWGKAFTDGSEMRDLSEITIQSHPHADGIHSSRITVSARLPRSDFQFAYQ